MQIGGAASRELQVIRASATSKDLTLTGTNDGVRVRSIDFYQINAPKGDKGDPGPAGSGSSPTQANVYAPAKAILKQGTNITITPDDTGQTLTINSTATSGSGNGDSIDLGGATPTINFAGGVGTAPNAIRQGAYSGVRNLVVIGQTYIDLDANDIWFIEVGDKKYLAQTQIAWTGDTGLNFGDFSIFFADNTLTGRDDSADNKMVLSSKNASASASSYSFPAIKVYKLANSSWGNISGKPTFAPANAEPNVQPDWNQTDDTKDDFIKNKPSGPKDWVKLGSGNWSNANASSTTISSLSDVNKASLIMLVLKVGSNYISTNNAVRSLIPTNSSKFNISVLDTVAVDSIGLSNRTNTSLTINSTSFSFRSSFTGANTIEIWGFKELDMVKLKQDGTKKG